MVHYYRPQREIILVTVPQQFVKQVARSDEVLCFDQIQSVLDQKRRLVGIFLQSLLSPTSRRTHVTAVSCRDTVGQIVKDASSIEVLGLDEECRQEMRTIRYHRARGRRKGSRDQIRKEYKCVGGEEQCPG